MSYHPTSHRIISSHITSHSYEKDNEAGKHRFPLNLYQHDNDEEEDDDDDNKIPIHGVGAMNPLE